ncbi:MAG TPA: restriction endonuclease [Longimicrobium sp.]|nr:restriction endonuclease [Longimicrobium sp.]
MPTATDYTRWIRLLDWHGLEMMWESILAESTPGWEPGKAFEYLILRAFELDGARVRWPYTVSVQGQLVEQIDGAVHAGPLSCIVEAKDTASSVRPDAVAKLRYKLGRRPPAVLGLLFSRTGFTEPARILTQFLAPQNILLWEGDDVAYALERRQPVWALEAKYRYCVEHGQPIRELRREVIG